MSGVEAGGGRERSFALGDGDLAATTIGARFEAAFREINDPQLAAPELVPARVARACATVLETDGAALCVLADDFRIPLGASDETATVAELLQFTQGEGPCLDAAQGHQVVVADSQQIDQRWPSFGAELFARTPFRGIATIPISLVASTRGALDLYLIEESALAAVRLADAVGVAQAAATALAAFDAGTKDNLDEWTGRPITPWLTTPSARQRRFVWLAVGMVMNEFRTASVDALALLRAHAYGNGIDLDALAMALVERQVTLEQLRAGRWDR